MSLKEIKEWPIPELPNYSNLLFANYNSESIELSYYPVAVSPPPSQRSNYITRTVSTYAADFSLLTGKTRNEVAYLISCPKTNIRQGANITYTSSYWSRTGNTYA